MRTSLLAFAFRFGHVALVLLFARGCDTAADQANGFDQDWQRVRLDGLQLALLGEFPRDHRALNPRSRRVLERTRGAVRAEPDATLHRRQD